MVRIQYANWALVVFGGLSPYFVVLLIYVLRDIAIQKQPIKTVQELSLLLCLLLAVVEGKFESYFSFLLAKFIKNSDK